MTAPLPLRCYTALSADESAVYLAQKLRASEPFFFVRYGDGAIECMTGKHGETCDHEPYGPSLGTELQKAWRALMCGCCTYPPVLVGDWLSASFDEKSHHARYEKEYDALVSMGAPDFLHFEALLLMRESEELVDFYRAVKEDSRRKVFMGPAECAGAAAMLGAEHLVTPMRDLFSHADRLTYELQRKSWEVLLYGAGMAGNIPAIRSWVRYPERTYISLGSAMDPLFRGKTRWQQITQQRARILFRELLDDGPRPVSVRRLD